MQQIIAELKADKAKLAKLKVADQAKFAVPPQATVRTYRRRLPLIKSLGVYYFIVLLLLKTNFRPTVIWKMFVYR